MLLTGCSVIKWLFGAIKLPLVSCDGGGVLLFNVNRLFCFWLSWIKNESGDWKIIPPEWHSTEAASWNRQWVERTFAWIVVFLWFMHQGTCVRPPAAARWQASKQAGRDEIIQPRFLLPGNYISSFYFLQGESVQIKAQWKIFPLSTILFAL